MNSTPWQQLNNAGSESVWYRQLGHCPLRLAVIALQSDVRVCRETIEAT